MSKRIEEMNFNELVKEGSTFLKICEKRKPTQEEIERYNEASERGVEIIDDMDRNEIGNTND